MKTVRYHRVCFAFLVLVAASTALARQNADIEGWVPLFPQEGIPEGWVVRAWNDVSQPLVILRYCAAENRAAPG